jgi:hypothetical protein
MSQAWMTLPVGIIIASAATSVGIGGGILWMPFFLIFLKLPPESAVLTSLIIQTAGMGSATAANLRKGRVDPKLAAVLFSFAIPGIALGAWITRKVAPAGLEFALGLLTLATAFTFVATSHKYGDPGANRAELKKAVRQGWMVSVMSIASGMLSISIGEWIIPLMRSQWAMRMSVAVATSIGAVFGSSLAGAVVHLGLGATVDGRLLLYAVPGVLIGGQLGPRIMERIHERHLKEVFVFLLTLIGIHLLFNSF